MSRTYIGFTNEQIQKVRGYYKEEPLYNNVRPSLSSCYTHYQALKPEELWYEAKRLCVILSHSNDACTSLYEYLEDMRCDLRDSEKDKEYVTVNSQGQILRTEINKHWSDIDSTINTIIECTRDMLYVMYRQGTSILILPYETKRQYKELIDVIDEYFTEKMDWYFRTREDVLDMNIRSGKFESSPDYTKANSDADKELYRERNFTHESKKEMDAANDFLLESYKADSVYGQCYGGIISTLTGLSICNGKTYGSEDYVYVFNEVKNKVEAVKKSSHPEIEITNVIGCLSREYNTGDGETQQKTILVALIFLIVVWDTLRDQSTEVKTMLTSCRTFIEYRYTSCAYTTNPLWKLVAERIPAEERPRIEDFQVENEKLKRLLEEKDAELQEANATLAEFRAQAPEGKTITEMQTQNEELRRQIAEYEDMPKGELNLKRSVNMLKDVFADVFDTSTKSEDEKQRMYSSVAYMFNCKDTTLIRDYLKPSRKYELTTKNAQNDYDTNVRNLRSAYNSTKKVVPSRD